MSNFSELQLKVISDAKKLLVSMSVISDISLNNVPTDDEIKKDYDEAVNQLAMESYYWNTGTL